VQRTIKIKVVPEQPTTLLETMEEYGIIYKLHADWAIANRTWCKQRAHENLYSKCRTQFPNMPSALVQCARDNAMESVKSTKFRRSIEPKKLATIRYDCRTATLRGQQLTLSSVGKRQKFILSVPQYFKEVFDTWKFTGCQLSYSKKTFWVGLNFKTEDPPRQTGEVLGVDRGIHNIVFTSRGERYSGKKVRKNRRKHLFNRRNLQAKGTRSAKRRRKSFSGSEKRFSKQINHLVSKWLVAREVTTFVLEDLSKITKKRGRYCNKRVSDWSFYQLDQFLTYKAEALGKTVEYVDRRYTSQRCSCCGHVDRTNRNKNKFKCVMCGFTDHADLNAAKNIRDSYLLLAHVGKAGPSQRPK
jgi:IS605 OrfB family transposase